MASLSDEYIVSSHPIMHTESCIVDPESSTPKRATGMQINDH